MVSLVSGANNNAPILASSLQKKAKIRESVVKVCACIPVLGLIAIIAGSILLKHGKALEVKKAERDYRIASLIRCVLTIATVIATVALIAINPLTFTVMGCTLLVGSWVVYHYSRSLYLQNQEIKRWKEDNPDI